jgi:hypothetical protein
LAKPLAEWAEVTWSCAHLDSAEEGGIPTAATAWRLAADEVGEAAGGARIDRAGPRPRSPERSACAFVTIPLAGARYIGLDVARCDLIRPRGAVRAAGVSSTAFA